MTRDEYRELADLWSDSAPADDQRELERLAQRTPRMARMAQWGELIVFALLAGTIVLSIVWSLGPATVLTGSLLVLLLAWSAWKRHHLTNISLLIDERDRLSFIRSSVRAKEAELNRSALGLALIFPGITMATLWGFSLRHPGGGEGELGAFLVAVMTAPRGLITLAFVLCGVLMLSLSHLRLRSELGQLRELREAYAEEERRDHFAGP